MKRTVLNFVVFQLGWFTTVIGAARGVPEAGIVAAAAAVALHLWLAKDHGRELVLLIMAGLLGGFFDSALVQTGWLVYPNGMLLPGTAPYWIVCLWLLFTTTLNVSLRWLRGRPLVAMVFGAVGGPLSYLGGSKLGALQFNDQTAAMIALAIGWAVMTPALVWLAQRLDGIEPQAETQGA